MVLSGKFPALINLVTIISITHRPYSKVLWPLWLVMINKPTCMCIAIMEDIETAAVCDKNSELCVKNKSSYLETDITIFPNNFNFIFVENYIKLNNKSSGENHISKGYKYFSEKYVDLKGILQYFCYSLFNFFLILKYSFILILIFIYIYIYELILSLILDISI